jgi:hypothetical protein
MEIVLFKGNAPVKYKRNIDFMITDLGGGNGK